jgi:hypothetical protein
MLQIKYPTRFIKHAIGWGPLGQFTINSLHTSLYKFVSFIEFFIEFSADKKLSFIDIYVRSDVHTLWLKGCPKASR